VSYTISISGHKDTAGPDEARAFEEDVAAKAREFVGSLEGVTVASMSGGIIGTVRLTQTVEPAREPVTEPAAEPAAEPALGDDQAAG